MARQAFWFLAFLALAAGLWGDFSAKTALHQILAQINYLIAAVFAVGAEIVGAITALMPKPTAEKLESIQSDDAVVL